MLVLFTTHWYCLLLISWLIMLVLFTTHYLTNCVGAVYYRCKARNFCGSFAWPASSACSNSPNTATACGFSLVSYVLYPEWCTILWYIHNIVYIYTHYKIRLAPVQALQIQHYLCYVLNTGLPLLMLCTKHWTATTYAIYYTLSYLYYFILGELSFFMLISVFFSFFSQQRLSEVGEHWECCRFLCSSLSFCSRPSCTLWRRAASSIAHRARLMPPYASRPTSG